MYEHLMDIDCVCKYSLIVHVDINIHLYIAQCVHRAQESPVTLEETDDGVWAHYPKSDHSVFHRKLAECVEDVKNVKEHILRDWVDYVGYDVGTMGNFTANYGVPNENPPETKQLL